MGTDVRELIGVSTESRDSDQITVVVDRVADAGNHSLNEEQSAETRNYMDPTQIPLPDFTTLGIATALRLRREMLGWSLPDVAAWLRIRLPYLEALEQGHPGELPGNAYAVGFLRTYASALGFPPEQIVSRFKRETRGVERKPELEFPAPEPERTVPAGAIVLTGIVVIIGTYIGWYRMVGHDPVPLERVPPVASVMHVRPGPDPSPQIASMMPDAGPSRMPDSRQAATTVPENTSADTPAHVAADSSSEPSADRMINGASAAAESGKPPLPMSPVPASFGEEATGAAAPVNQLPAIRAVGVSWIQVKSNDGKVIYDHIMQPGDNWPLPSEGAPFSLTVGNAGGITLAAHDVITVPLGRNGAVRRNVILSPETMMDGSIAAAAPVSGPAPAVPPTSGLTPGEPEAETKAINDEPVPLPPPPVIKPRVRPAETARPEPSADDLNAMQLRTMNGPGRASGPH
ncbi:RodZ domain-containing protein [Acetobacter oeni]|uniref:Cytoskeleton protein RodZ-like C-terminal domain-containing protein n=1 Tax=Acetobacter oeni TaxID=304077 RepID=A0A511XL54_9PROT|nr:RodZ domain-containing protein [Acetobacter oeni]MBB3883207.1 cytoskeleton protein RodZ [Acetobacter oeni]NHO19273.1 DUF4115 domain-containing protein [Acetobacter oeni]GBR07313.1 hypothetical protein AA21952_2310 [Acetobacter oeni LMG 21952]GEN63644.1 hypothetical protein AOE01nite_18680 [Acetobacter oeni]